jgi:hypothetical protein
MSATLLKRLVRPANLDEPTIPLLPLSGHGSKSTQETPRASVYLRIRVSDKVTWFELSANSEAVVTVGSGDEVDARLQDPAVPALLCFFERIDDDVWLVPAYSTSALRVNAARVNGPRRLGTRTVIEFGLCYLTAELQYAPPKDLLSEVGIEVLSDIAAKVAHLHRLPIAEQPTSLPWPQGTSVLSSPDLSQTISVNRWCPSSSTNSQSPKKAGIVPLRRTLRGIARCDSERISANQLQLEHGGACPGSEGRSPPGAVSVVSPGSHRASSASCPRSDWLYVLGRGAKRHPTRTRLMAILLALIGAALVVCATQAFLVRLGK